MAHAMDRRCDDDFFCSVRSDVLRIFRFGDRCHVGLPGVRAAVRAALAAQGGACDDESVAAATVRFLSSDGIRRVQGEKFYRVASRHEVEALDAAMQRRLAVSDAGANFVTSSDARALLREIIPEVTVWSGILMPKSFTQQPPFSNHWRLTHVRRRHGFDSGYAWCGAALTALPSANQTCAVAPRTASRAPLVHDKERRPPPTAPEEEFVVPMAKRVSSCTEDAEDEFTTSNADRTDWDAAATIESSGAPSADRSEASDGSNVEGDHSSRSSSSTSATDGDESDSEFNAALSECGVDGGWEVGCLNDGIAEGSIHGLPHGGSILGQCLSPPSETASEQWALGVLLHDEITMSPRQLLRPSTVLEPHGDNILDLQRHVHPALVALCCCWDERRALSALVSASFADCGDSAEATREFLRCVNGSPAKPASDGKCTAAMRSQTSQFVHDFHAAHALKHFPLSWLRREYLLSLGVALDRANASDPVCIGAELQQDADAELVQDAEAVCLEWLLLRWSERYPTRVVVDVVGRFSLWGLSLTLEGGNGPTLHATAKLRYDAAREKLPFDVAPNDGAASHLIPLAALESVMNAVVQFNLPYFHAAAEAVRRTAVLFFHDAHLPLLFHPPDHDVSCAWENVRATAVTHPEDMALHSVAESEYHRLREWEYVETLVRGDADSNDDAGSDDKSDGAAEHAPLVAQRTTDCAAMSHDRDSAMPPLPTTVETSSAAATVGVAEASLKRGRQAFDFAAFEALVAGLQKMYDGDHTRPLFASDLEPEPLQPTTWEALGAATAVYSRRRAACYERLFHEPASPSTT